MTSELSLQNKSVLVTGGAGFVGSHLVDALIREKAGKIVVASNFFLGSMDNLADAKINFPSLKIVRCDVADYEEIRDVLTENPVEVVFNLAVIPLPTSLVRPEWTIRKNIDMTTNLCRLQREGFFKTLIQYSSSEAYGSAKTIPMTEEHPHDPETPYAASKAATDFIALSYYHTFGQDIVVIRPFNQYGPRQNAKKYAGIIPLVIGKILRGEVPVIYGDGEQTRDYLYVDDTIGGTLAAYKNPASRGKIINIASGKEISINYLVKKIAELMGYTGEIIYKESRPGDVRRHVADITLAKNLLGWQPVVSFEEGLHQTVEWYTKNKDLFS